MMAGLGGQLLILYHSNFGVVQIDGEWVSKLVKLFGYKLNSLW